jgi:aminoglycoside phosphotransferase family enzyme/predicted kinase
MGTLKQDLLALGMELRETHISEVYLAADRVYKVKKPVQLGFLDFGTLTLRKRACDVEVELNRRLSRGVYLGVVPIVRDAAGVHQLWIGLRAEHPPVLEQIVEYAVEMQRLPDEQAADVLLQKGRLAEADVVHIAQHLARFHAQARCDAETAYYGQARVIEANVVENFEQTQQSALEFLSQTELNAIDTWQRSFLDRHKARFRARIEAERIRDGHGDLRLEHCYLSPDGDVQIIDCIEFNDRYRYGDVCADVAFLAMDLVFQQRIDLSEAFLAAYAQASDDYDLYGVVDFYESYRAYVRGKVSSMLANDAHASEGARTRARGQARKYYMLAHACACEPLERPKLYIVGGVIAAGKSSVARQLAAFLHAPIVSADVVRKRVAGVAEVTPWHDAAFCGHYAPEQTHAVYTELLRRAQVVLESGRSVILDASFRLRSERADARAVAQRCETDFVFIECKTSPEVCRARLRERAKAAPSASDGRLDIFDAFMRSYEPVTELPRNEYWEFDTSCSREQTAAQLSAVLRGG